MLLGGKLLVWRLSLLVAMLAVFWVLAPLAEFTSDDGAWLLDAHLRWKEMDWFTIWMTSAQGPRLSPLPGLALILPMAVHPSVFSAQVFLFLCQLATVFLVWRIGAELRLRWQGLIAATLFLLLPAISLNYAGKLFNPGFSFLASAFLLWARICNRGQGWKRWALLFGALAVAVQVHYAFLVFLLPIGLDLLLHWTGARPRPGWAVGFGAAAVGLLGWSAIGLPGVAHVRSLVDLITTGSGYMLSRSAPLAQSEPAGGFFPWELLPLFLALVVLPLRVSAWGGPRKALWLYTAASILGLAMISAWRGWSPHHWLLPWVLPCLLLTETGFEYGLHLFKRQRVLPIAVLLSMMGIAAFQTVLVASGIATSGGTGWHGPSISTKREVMSYVASAFPEHELFLATPGVEWTESLVGWSALASLPAEHLGKVARGSKGAIFIEERGSVGALPEFADYARSRGWEELRPVKDVHLWRTTGPIAGFWPKVAVITRRALAIANIKTDRGR